MIRRHTTTLRLALMAADAASAGVLFVLVSIARFGERWQVAWREAGVDPVPLAAGYAALYTAVLWALGLYRLRARWSWRSDAIDVARAVLLVAVVAFTALFWLRLPDVSRLFLLGLFAGQGAVTLASRLTLRAFFRWIRSRGYNSRFVLIVGTGPEAERFANRIEARPELGLRVIGHVLVPAGAVERAAATGGVTVGRAAAAAGVGGDVAPERGAPTGGVAVAHRATDPNAADPPTDPGRSEVSMMDPRPATTTLRDTAVGSVVDPAAPATVPQPRRPILGDVEEIERVLHEHVVDEVAICVPAGAWPIVEPVARLCEEEGKIVRIPLAGPGGLGGFTLPGGRVEDFDGTPLLSLVYGPDRIVSLALKRAVDVALALVGLVVLAPVFLGIALLLRLREGPPVIFRQTRVGLHGRPFTLFKFRTMCPDAEARLPELLEQNEIEGQAFKLSNDPRLTPTGRWLRRTSLDELPQLWNVLRGEMSLVGPRPPLPREVAAYDVWHRRRLSMKPGITGLWQVSARLDDEFDRWVALDLAYIDRWSLWLDLKIMLRTIPAMLQGR